MLACKRCKLMASGCNNCNEKSGQCSRFTPIWADKKTYTVTSDGCVMFIPAAHKEIRNPMLDLNLREIVDAYNVELFLNEVNNVQD